MLHIRKHYTHVVEIAEDQPFYVPDFCVIRRVQIRRLWPYRHDCFVRRQIRMIIADCRALEGDM
jgi:hypothetical protein